jgi:hypothetical protein
MSGSTARSSVVLVVVLLHRDGVHLADAIRLSCVRPRSSSYAILARARRRLATRGVRGSSSACELARTRLRFTVQRHANVYRDSENRPSEKPATSLTLPRHSIPLVGTILSPANT